MSVLFPAFLLGLLALAVPLLLHLIRRRVTRTVPFPALRFLAANRAEQRQNKLRRRLVLALRCLALAALAAAFARPFLGSPPPPVGRAQIVVVDNSFSLHTGDRWPELLRQSRAALGTLGRADTLGILLAHPRPHWLHAPGRDTDAALAALASLRPGWHGTRVEPALRLAASTLASAPARERRIVFLGDHQALGWSGTDFGRKLPAGVEVWFPAPSPAPARQAALGPLELTRRGDSWLAQTTVRNFSPAHHRTLNLHLDTSPQPIATLGLDLAADSLTPLSIPLPSLPPDPAPTYLTASLDHDDLPADDQTWTLAPIRAPADRLLLLDRSSPAPGAADYVATAFAALADLPPSLRVLPPPASDWPLPALAVLRDDASFAGPSGERLDAFLHAGGSALIFLGPGPALQTWLARHDIRPTPLAPARIRDWSLDHPFVAPLAAQSLRALVSWDFSRAWALPPDAVEPLAFWTDSRPALGELRLGQGRLLLAGFAPDRRDGDWPLQPAFVPFLHHAATYLLDLNPGGDRGPARVGDTLPADPDPGAPPSVWRALAGPANTSPGLPITGNFPAPGIYAEDRPGAPRHLVAVALDPAESDLAPWAEGKPWRQLVQTSPLIENQLAPRLAAATGEAESQSPLWWWAFAALALFALAELALANRTAR